MKEAAAAACERFKEGARQEVVALPDPCSFSKVNTEVPDLKDYYAETYPPEYWSKWPAPVEHLDNPWLVADEIEAIWQETRCVSRKEVDQLLQDVRHGADIGCRGSGRLPTVCRNNKSAHEFGDRLADSLVTWIKTGIASGPFSEEEIKRILPDGFTVNPLQVAVKEDGKARPVVDMSAPHAEPGVVPQPGVGTSVNSGIDISDFPSKMSSIEEISRILEDLGRPAVLTKIDWSDAYKHCTVRRQDRCLQVLKFGDKYIIEERITFGSSSSPGIFERPSWFLLRAAVCKAGADQRRVCKQIDDALVFGAAGDPACQRVYDEYRKLAARMGARLAPETKREKAFPPSSGGVALGVELDLAAWTWRIPTKKVVAIRHSLDGLLRVTAVEMAVIRKLVGRLNHYSTLVDGGKVERAFLTDLQTVGERAGGINPVAVTEAARETARWWLAAIPAATQHTAIRGLVDRSVVFNDFHAHMDAAGGSVGSANGAGGWVVETGDFFHLTWPDWLQGNEANTLGVQFASKLSFLEALAALLTVMLRPRLFKGRRLLLSTDNSGFLGAWRRQAGKDPYLHTIVHALRFLERGLEMNLHVTKVARCSTDNDLAADYLSKARFGRARGTVRLISQLRPHQVVVDWLRDPRPTRLLGKKLLAAIEDDGVSVLWFEPRHFG